MRAVQQARIGDHNSRIIQYINCPKTKVKERERVVNIISACEK